MTIEQNLGKRVTLMVVKKVEFGVYLGTDDDKVLLPGKQVPEGIEIGDPIEVFIYKDSQDRLIATTAEPKITLGEVKALTVADTGRIGAFLDWGLEKDLLLPFREQTAKLKKGDVLVVGCSSSEMVGGHIGKDSSIEAARALYAGAAPVLAEKGVWLAAQCCEHLNRAIILEREAAEKYGWEEVCVVPRPHAGGSWATTCWKNFKDPVAVEEIRANAGMDIGGTLIGMHLKRVAVPVRLSLNKIGEANILCAYTRPKLIGGERARYTEED